MNQLKNDIVELYKQFKFNDAIKKCNQLLNLDQKNDDAVVFKALCLLHQPYGRIYDDPYYMGRGLNWLNLAIEINPENAIPHFYKVGTKYQLALLEKGDQRVELFNQLSNDVQKCLDITPHYPKAWFFKGQIIKDTPIEAESCSDEYKVANLKRVNNAIESYMKCVQEKDQFQSMEETDSLKKELIRKNVTSNTIIAHAWFNMGVLYYKLGKDEAQFYDKSIKCYLKSIDVCPFPTTYQALANSYQKMNDTANSMKYHEMILQDDPINSTVLYNLACIENTTDKKDKAIEHLRTAIQYNSILKKNAEKDDEVKDIVGEL